ncbi:hypothetical protein C1H46_036618 [Malus baccata]|uniref:Uncharacterized protein n=1 Tax=Malus baccata TaxID=106549 RepID=A0A540KUH3_MALBA|nr:hypothetical protein C1H46_036618 [Malus baccata]
MVRRIPEVVANNFASMPLAIALFVSVSTFVALCAKANHVCCHAWPGKQTKSPSAAPKKLVASLNNKAVPLVSKNKGEEVEVVDDGFGE